MTEERVPSLDDYPQDERFHILREASGHSSRISIERVYIEAMGKDVLGGLFVSQLVFWSGKGKRRDGWFYRKADEWLEKDYINRYQLDKYTETCVNAGWLETKNMRANGAPTRHYRINQAAFVEWVNQYADLSKSANPFVENNKTRDLSKSAKPEQTPTYTNSRERAVSRRQRDASPTSERIRTADELGIAPAQLTKLTNAILDITGLRALADAGDDYKLLDAQDAAIHLARMGYGSVDLLKDLHDGWKAANQWRNGTRPTIRNLKEFASQRTADHGAQATSAWAQLNGDAPDYMKG